MMHVRSYTPDDYYQVNAWWAFHWHHDVPPKVLPKTGFVVELDGQLAAAGFLLISKDCPVCMLEYVVANPTLPSLSKGKAVKLVIDAAKFAANKEFGLDAIIYTVSPNNAYLGLCQKMGFEQGEVGMTSLVYSVGSDTATFKES